MKAHLRYAQYLARHKWFVLVAGLRLNRRWRRMRPELHIPLWRLLIHDFSKLSSAEWGPYVRRFFSGRAGALDKASDPEEFHRAWTHHWHHNPHHWEHWLVLKDDGTLRPMRMPDNFAAEMVADWMGAGRAITGKWEAAEWYRKNAAKMLLEVTTRYRAEALLGLTCPCGSNANAAPSYCLANGYCEVYLSGFDPGYEALPEFAGLPVERPR